MKRLEFISLTVGAASVLLATADASTIFGPSPYLGSFDSPFLAGIEAGTIYLEDFEDGALNTPFVTSTGMTVKTIFPGNRAHSVDADDGLDGDFMGFGGDAWEARDGGNDFTFEVDLFGRYPTFVGFVLTDIESFTDPSDFPEITFIDPSGDGPEEFEEIRLNPSGWPVGGLIDTRAHRFFGVFHEAGIQSLSFDRGVDQIDHLQYGYAIPEPGCGVLAFMGTILMLARRRRR